MESIVEVGEHTLEVGESYVKITGSVEDADKMEHADEDEGEGEFVGEFAGAGKFGTAGADEVTPIAIEEARNLWKGCVSS